MKIIEAMKRVKANKEKMADLRGKISAHSAHLSHETPMYPDTKSKITEWAQSCNDLSLENVRLLTSIAKTNIQTNVTIKLGDNSLTKSIAEWIWRRREYAATDLAVWTSMGDRNLKEGAINTSTGVQMEIKLIRNYDPELRDKRIAIYKSEPHEIDAQMEVINAVTDLVE